VLEQPSPRRTDKHPPGRRNIVLLHSSELNTSTADTRRL
jgi:hypothetical protein